MTIRKCSWCNKKMIFKHYVVKRGRSLFICSKCYRQYLREISLKNHNKRIAYKKSKENDV